VKGEQIRRDLLGLDLTSKSNGITKKEPKALVAKLAD
jgi:hypothetical protein